EPGDVCVLPVHEYSQGLSDLNGDGDTSDVVGFVVDAGSGAVINSHLALSPNYSPYYVRVMHGPTRAVIVAFEPSQAGAPNADLNGDGDVLDVVPVVFDLPS